MPAVSFNGEIIERTNSLWNLSTSSECWCTRPAGKANAELQMLVEANNKPHDIMIYTDGSVTGDTNTMVSTELCPKSDQSGDRSSHIYNTVASIPKWYTDYSCHHSHRLNEPAAKGGAWNGLPRLAHTHAWSLTIKASVGILPWACRIYWKWTGRWTGKHCKYHIWSASWQEGVAQRLGRLCGHARASQHWFPEGKRSGERKRPDSTLQVETNIGTV